MVGFHCCKLGRNNHCCIKALICDILHTSHSVLGLEGQQWIKGPTPTIKAQLVTLPIQVSVYFVLHDLHLLNSLLSTFSVERFSLVMSPTWKSMETFDTHPIAAGPIISPAYMQCMESWILRSHIGRNIGYLFVCYLSFLVQSSILSYLGSTKPHIPHPFPM